MSPVKGFREWLQYSLIRNFIRNYLEWCFYYSYSYCFERFLLACVVMNCHSSSSLSPFFVSHLVLNSTHGFKDIRGEGYCWYLGISRTDFHVDLYLKKIRKWKKIPRAHHFLKMKGPEPSYFFYLALDGFFRTIPKAFSSFETGALWSLLSSGSMSFQRLTTVRQYNIMWKIDWGSWWHNGQTSFVLCHLL